MLDLGAATGARPAGAAPATANGEGGNFFQQLSRRLFGPDPSEPPKAAAPAPAPATGGGGGGGSGGGDSGLGSIAEQVEA